MAKELRHILQVNGLPIGYPVILDEKGATINLPDEILLEDAIRMNEESKLDSIEEIKDMEQWYLPIMHMRS